MKQQYSLNVFEGLNGNKTATYSINTDNTRVYQKGGEFDKWYQSLPVNKQDTSNYNLRRAFELAPQEDLENYRTNPDAHLYTSYPNKKGEYEFLKSKNHPTVNKELDWYYSSDPSAIDFRKKYSLDKSGQYYKYVPKKFQKGGNKTIHRSKRLGDWQFGWMDNENKQKVPFLQMKSPSTGEYRNMIMKRPFTEQQYEDMIRMEQPQLDSMVMETLTLPKKNHGGHVKACVQPLDENDLLHPADSDRLSYRDNPIGFAMKISIKKCVSNVKIL